MPNTNARTFSFPFTNLKTPLIQNYEYTLKLHIDTTKDLSEGKDFKLTVISTGIKDDPTGEFIIDYGDGVVVSSKNLIGGKNTHNYTNTGQYVISLFLKTEFTNKFEMKFRDNKNITKIEGKLLKAPNTDGNFNYCFYNCSSLESVPVDLFEDVSISTINSCFMNCTSLKTIPVGIFNNQRINSCNECFCGCSSITTIPSNLFETSKYLQQAGYCFKNTKITEIPEDLFTGLTVLSLVSGCFENTPITVIPSQLFKPIRYGLSICREIFKNCTNLTSIPMDLFKDNPDLLTVDSCFEGCTSIIEIPAGLFKNKASLETASRCFSMCSGITTVAPDIFDGSTNIVNFELTFYDCINITSNVPILWTRYNVTSCYGCFLNCTKAANYSSIPSGWR